ncbi:CHAT domain-containing protein [Bradyrhizobium sp. 2TAF24]|uniref:CHAT domain-containing protein n=1 Tax=Bradyrhizobium sp. 2TAF24 TaxID=3233011 RepID=UPI003F917667
MAVQREDAKVRAVLATAIMRRQSGDLRGAALLYREASALAGAAGDHKAISIAHDNLGNILADLGDFDAARASYREALAHETDPRIRRIIRSNDARVLGDIGELRLAANVLRQQVDDLDEIGGGPELPIALDNAAMALSRLGDHATARALLTRAEVLLRDGPADQRAVNALSLSNINVTLDDRPAAATWFGTAYDLYMTAARQSIDVAHYRRGFARALKQRLADGHPIHSLFFDGVLTKDTDRWEESRAAFQRGARDARIAGDVALALRFMANEAAMLSDRNRLGPALALIQRIRTEASQLGLARSEMMATGTLASILLGGADTSDPLGPLGLYARAKVLHETHVRIVAEYPVDAPTRLLETADSGAVAAQLAKMAAEHHADDLAMQFFQEAIPIARKNYQTMVQFAQGKRPTIPFELPNRLAGLWAAARASGQSTVAQQAADEIETLQQQGEMTIRGRLVAQRMLGDHYTDSDPPRAIRHFRDACAAAEALKQQVLIGDGRSDVARGHADVFPKLARLLRLAGQPDQAFETLQAIKARRVGEAAAKRAGAASETLPRVADAIRLLADLGGAAPTVFAELSVEKDGLTAYLVDAAGVRAVHVAANVAAGHQADRGDINERPRRLVQYCLEDPDLRAFVGAIAAALPERCRVLLSASGFLVNVPLHLVPLDGRPWCERFAISTIPAIGVLQYAARDVSPRDLTTVGGDSRHDLPHAARECAAIADLLKTEPLVGGDCSAINIRARLQAGHHQLLHLALHGRGDARRGARASVLLADADGPRWVGLHELFTRDVSIRLAVLSGCSTAVAGPLHGHELTGVAGAAAEAGVSSIIACLWPVEDAVAEHFMTELYAIILQQRDDGVIDLVAAMDGARTALRQWMAGAGERGQRRNGRDLSLGPLDDEAPAATVADALAWAPFVLIGRPVLTVTA